MVDPSPPEQPSFKDRRAGLIAFGVAQMLMALGMVSMAALQFVLMAKLGGFAPPGAAPASKWGLFGAGLFYLLLAVLAVVLGMGSIRCRRWARALNLVLASLGLAMGVLVSIVMAVLAPGMVRSLESQMGGALPGFGFIMGCMAVGMAFLYLIVPAAFVVFYRSRHVRATCEFYDTKTRWTDRLPLPVLAGALIFLSGSGSIVTPAMGFGVPFFGWIATGAAAWLVAGGLAVASTALAWGLFRIQRWGWLGALAFIALSAANVLITLRGKGLLELYENMQVPIDQLEVIDEMGLTGAMMPMMAAMMLIWFGFYLWLGRYFKAGETLLGSPG